MIREHMQGIIPAEKHFHWRGGEITRLEGFSDAVFAFAVTLLVVSLEVPRTFHELIEAVRVFPSFAVCFALLTNVWFEHYRFFRRYGLQTPWSVFLNCVLLFFVLFYVYPLKFLFFGMLNGTLGADAGQVRTLFVIYGAGYSAVFLVLALLYLQAWRRRSELALDQLERSRTARSLVDHMAMALIGLASSVLAVTLPLRWISIAGYFYFVVGVYFTVAGTMYGKRERRLVAALGRVKKNSTEYPNKPESIADDLPS